MSYLVKLNSPSIQWVENYTPQPGESLIEVIPANYGRFYIWDGTQFVFSQALKDAEDLPVNTAASLDTQAANALANLRAYRDLAAPTPAQTVAVVKLLCRIVIGLIRIRLNQLDAAD